MKKKFQKKSVFLYGLGDRKSDYRSLEKYFLVPKIDWNRERIIPKLGKRVDVLVGFSFGGILGCLHAMKHNVGTLVLCSLPPGLETLEKVRAEKVIFMAGEREEWCIKDLKRIARTLPRYLWKIVIVPKADHKIVGNYKKELLKIVSDAKNETVGDVS